MKYSLEAQIEEVTRELALRGTVFPHLVRTGKMRQSIADMHVARMESVLATLVFLIEHRDEFIAFLKTKKAPEQSAPVPSHDVPTETEHR